MLDENEFLSPYGVRSVSRYHLDHPLVMQLDGQEYRLDYEPGESTTDLFGGNSNWRGPIWCRSTSSSSRRCGNITSTTATRSRSSARPARGSMMTLEQVAEELARRLARIFLRDAEGKRPVFGACRCSTTIPHWRDLIPFHEYFHGDTGRGCGASHQTGWTGLIAQILIELDERALPPEAADMGARRS